MRAKSRPESPQLTVALAAFLDACRSASTRSAYEVDLRHLAAWCRDQGPLNLLSIDANDVARYRTECELAGASAATVARRLSAFTSFAAFAAAQGAAPALTQSSDVSRPVVASHSTAELLTDVEAEALLAAADALGKRCAALIRILMLDGLKVGEVIRADASDVAGRSPRMRLRLHDRRARTVELHTDTATALSRYLGRRRDGPLFLSEQRGREAARLTRFGVDYLVKRVAHDAGLSRPISGNTLRRRYVTAAHTAGTHIEMIRHNTGHADTRSARRYLDPRSDEPAAS